MTYEDCLDSICLKEFNHYWIMNNRRSRDEVIQIMSKAAELYARSKWEEACDAQKRNCSIQAKVLSYEVDFYGETIKKHMVDELSVMNATQPEFKP